jgi:hypothetical protein
MSMSSWSGGSAKKPSLSLKKEDPRLAVEASRGDPGEMADTEPDRAMEGKEGGEKTKTVMTLNMNKKRP